MPTPPKKTPAAEDPVAAAKAYLAGLEGSSEPWGGPAQPIAGQPVAAPVAVPPVGTGGADPLTAAAQLSGKPLQRPSRGFQDVLALLGMGK